MGGREFACIELCGSAGHAGPSDLDQLVEDGTVLDHCAAELFGCSGATTGSCSDSVRQAVVIHDPWIIDGDVGGALLEAGTRIAASFEKGIDQIVGFSSADQITSVSRPSCICTSSKRITVDLAWGCSS